jgi:hypothetical protein
MNKPRGTTAIWEHLAPHERRYPAVLRKALRNAYKTGLNRLSRRFDDYNRPTSQHQAFKYRFIEWVRDGKMHCWQSTLHTENDLKAAKRSVTLSSDHKPNLGLLAGTWHRPAVVEFEPVCHSERSTNFFPSWTSLTRWTRRGLIVDSVRAKLDRCRRVKYFALSHDYTWLASTTTQPQGLLNGITHMAHTCGLDHRETCRNDAWPDLGRITRVLEQDRHRFAFAKWGFRKALK